MDTVKIYIVLDNENRTRGVGFTKAEAWQHATEQSSNPVVYVIKYLDSGWYCKEYTLLK